MKKVAAYISIFLLALTFSGCNTYYIKNRKFNASFSQGQLDKAESILLSDKKGPRRNTRVLYYLNLGTVNTLQGNYQKSNEYFEQALVESESIEKNYALTAASLLTNPNVIPYRGENFELLMVHFYKALNYLYLRDYDAALVECRRMDIKLGELRDKYVKDNRYKYDAFLHNLMGIIYEADHDYNNAFIAYRNAYNYYTDNYSKLYGMDAPEQLKHDLLRAAHRTGFYNEVSFYEKKFGMKYQPENNADATGELVFFWMNGLGPVKDEWSINFQIVRGEGGWVTFTNSEYGWSFPFYYPEGSNEESAFSKLEFVRLAMPRYLERAEIYTAASLQYNGQQKQLEEAEDISQIAYQSLQDRLLRDLSESLLRLAVKKAAEYAAQEQNQNAGAAVGIVNFLTEQPDTRNWQTLPHSIYYTRVKLPAGQQKVSLQMRERQTGQPRAVDFTYDIRKDQTSFQVFHTMEALPPSLYREQ